MQDVALERVEPRLELVEPRPLERAPQVLVLDAAARAGLAVPDDLSVIGFDDIELAAAIGLTTVRQPLRESGRIGAQLLLRALDGGATAPAALPELAVVKRRTVGPPA